MRKRTLTIAVLVLIGSLAAAQPPAAPPADQGSQVEIVVDLTTRMGMKIGGESTRLDLARKHLDELFRELSVSVPVGLTVVGGAPEAACTDVRRLVEAAPGSAAAIRAALADARPAGKGSILEALRVRLAEAVASGRETDIVIISDMVEPCAVHACEVIQTLPAAPPSVRTVLVGFQRDPTHRPLIDCLVQRMNGFYVDIFSAWGLVYLIRPPVNWQAEKPTKIVPFVIEAERSFLSSLNSLAPLRLELPATPQIHYFRLILSGLVEVGGGYTRMGPALVMGKFLDKTDTPISERQPLFLDFIGGKGEPGASPVDAVLLRTDQQVSLENRVVAIPDGAAAIELATEDQPIVDNSGYWRGVMLTY